MENTEEDTEKYEKPTLKTPPPPEILILDMDSLVYQASLVPQKTQYVAMLGEKELGVFDRAKEYGQWKNDSEMFGDILFGVAAEDLPNVVRKTNTVLGDPKDAYDALDTIIEQWLKASKCSDWIGYIGNDDSKSNFRYFKATRFPYKGGRSAEKPAYLKETREYAKKNPKVRVAPPHIEADDKVVMASQKYKHRCCIGYIDKDIANTQGCYLFNMNTMDAPVFSSKKIIGTLEKSGNKVFGTGVLHLFHQALTGDTVDNIKCIPRIGPIKSYNLLNKFSGVSKKHTKDAFQIVAGIYKETFGEEHIYKHLHSGLEVSVGWKDVLRENLTLLHMVRWEGDSVDWLMEMLE